MAVVRELVTVLATQFDSKGVVQYEAAVNRVKELAISVGKVLGIAFSIQKIGVAYTTVAETFREFLQASRESKISQEELLKATENVFKASAVDRISGEQQERLFQILKRIDFMGKASPRMIGMLGQVSASTLKLLENYFHTNLEGLRELAKQGKLTFEEIVTALGRASPELEDKFAKLPWTISRAWRQLRNDIVAFAAEFLKSTRLT